LSKLTKAPIKSGRSATPKTLNVVVVLTAHDHKEATTAAKLSHQNVADWISSLVNTALQP
jgi:hypothetical protein